MTGIPRRLLVAAVGVFSVHVVVFAVVVGLGAPGRPTAWLALVLFLAGLAAGLTGRGARLDRARTATVAGCAIVLPALGAVGLSPLAGYAGGGWYVGGVACLVLTLLWRDRVAIGAAAFVVLAIDTAAWAGIDGLNSFGVLAAGLVLAVLWAAGRALARTAEELERYSAVEREAVEWQAAQDAYATVRQRRLRDTARMGAPMLQRIVDGDGRLDPAERREARIMEQSIRDEIRGRALLNDAVRVEVLRLRRAGAVVQVNDDGGLDDLDPADLAAMLNRIAEALAQLHSDRVIIRTAPPESRIALTVVAMSVDPIAAALGMEDEDEQVDLWLELERPVAAAPGLGRTAG